MLWKALHSAFKGLKFLTKVELVSTYTTDFRIHTGYEPWPPG